MTKLLRVQPKGAKRVLGPLVLAAGVLAAGSASAAITPIQGISPRLTSDTRSSTQASTASQTRRVFVNFAGTALSLASPDAPDDATRNLTRMESLAKRLEGYGGTAPQREAILQAVRSDWDAYDVVVTDRRPESGDYVMNHVGPNRPDDMGSKVLGIAHLDCGDRLMRNDVSFAFHSAEDGHEPGSVAMTISQEVAHAFGLEHVDDPNDIMFPARGVADPKFVNGCAPVVPADGIGIACTDQHIDVCGDPELQNSHGELLMLLGPARTDLTPPVVDIAADADALMVQEGDSFRLAVAANDDVLVDRVKLFLDGEEVAVDTTAPFGWKLTEIEPGEYEFYVEAFDMSGNSSLSDPMMVYVGVEPPAGVDAATPYADSEDIGGDPGVGCSCTTGRQDLDLAWALPLLPLLFRRRRR